MPAPPPILILPFVLLLGAMALAPVLAPAWWLKHYPKVALGLGAITAGAYLLVLGDSASLGHAAHEYVSFMALVGSLYIVAGGIQIRVPGGATPLANVIFLFTGAIAANVLGTTGAAMLLIRPWMEMNRDRLAPYHIVFFIFLVANIGGCLTPIGDPPLFLGYLQGIPFWWVAQKCWPMWAVGVGWLLALFWVVDRIGLSRAPNLAPKPDATPGGWPGYFVGNPVPQTSKSAVSRVSKPADATQFQSPADLEIGDTAGLETCGTTVLPESAKTAIKIPGWQLNGLPNLFFLALLLGAVFIQRPPFLREGLMLAAAAGSYFTTRKSIHAANEFNFHPVTEVAVLFAGIFATMIPALAWLDQGAARWLGSHPGPGIFYWGTGGLSAVLDNAPTYLGFLGALLGVTGAGQIAPLLDHQTSHVVAVSVGAVFFGAATYLGNGPNFMVKAIAGQHGVSMPSFGGFVLKYSLPFLLPGLLAIWLFFFRG